MFRSDSSSLRWVPAQVLALAVCSVGLVASPGALPATSPAALPAAFAQPIKTDVKAFAGIGRTATPAEVKAWDIDVRPDFKGLPKGQGSVGRGEGLWDAQCASCHGSFGESAAVFTPLAGGVTAQDLKTGRVEGLMPGSNQPQRTTLMKLSTLSTLWDYINRAMPWNAPKSLSANDVYAVTAYILNLNNVVPANFTLSDQNIRDVQALLPNRNGMTTAHALWPGKELGGSTRPDAPGSDCMRDCQPVVAIKSFLPDYARNAHGNLAEQSRGMGPVRGVDTTQAAPNLFMARGVKSKPATTAISIRQSATEKIANTTNGSTPLTTAEVMPLLQKNACLACHGMSNKMVGPSFNDVSSKYKERVDAVNYLSGKIKLGGQGVWGSIPMPAQSLSLEEAAQVAIWLAQGMNK